MPPKHKGISANEKRERILRIFTDRKEIFSYAQLEKEAEKVGIRRDQVKDILESLISDTLVETESLGVSKCYWSLPSQALIRLRQKCGEYTDKIEQGNIKQIELEQSIEQAKIGREMTEQRKLAELSLSELSKQNQQLEKEIQSKQRFDPDRLKQLKQETINLKDEANRWTDDIIQLTFYLKSQAGMNVDRLEQIGLPNEIDNI